MSTTDPANVVVEPPRRVLRLLVAEDDPTSRLMITRQVERLGHDVRVVADGLEAWTELQDGSYDVLVTDLHMPGLDGLGLAERVRENERRTNERLPIVVLTASVPEDADRCLVDAFVTKPVRPEELEDVLDSILGVAGGECVPGTFRPPASNHGEAGIAEADASLIGHGLPALDPSLLEEVFDGITDEALDTLDGFAQSVAPTVARLESALGSGDFEQTARSAHGIAGAARMAGAIELGALCSEIEEAADRGEVEGASALIERVHDALSRLEQAIDRLRREHQA